MNHLTPAEQEHVDHVFGAQYDDIRERYAAELADIARANDAEFDRSERLAAEEAGLTVEALRERIAAERASEWARYVATRDAALVADDCPF